MRKVLVVNNSADCGSSYYLPFARFGEETGDSLLLGKDPDSIALVVFTGGEDITPELYGEAANPKSHCNLKRDKREKAVFERAVALQKPIAGICRGSQLICALSGGKLVQHITGHSGSHPLTLDNGDKMTVSSTHHQMQLPPEDAVPIGWADPRRSTCYEGPPGVSYKPDLEYDIVWYPRTNAIGMQYHPEYMLKSSDGFNYPTKLLQRFFGLEPDVER